MIRVRPAILQLQQPQQQLLGATRSPPAAASLWPRPAGAVALVVPEHTREALFQVIGRNTGRAMHMSRGP